MPAPCLYACLLPIRLPAASMLAFCQYACPAASMLAYCQYACLLPLCLPSANTLAFCLYACLLPMCLPAASMLAFCQYACPAASMLAYCQYACLLPLCLPFGHYACLLPLCLPTANTPACCLYACLLPICLPPVSMLAYCQHACLLPQCLPTANMPACPYVCCYIYKRIAHLCLLLWTPIRFYVCLSANMFLFVCLSVRSTNLSVCLSACLYGYSFSGCLPTFLPASTLLNSLYFFRHICLSLRLSTRFCAFLYMYVTIPVCTSLCLTVIKYR
jgi:hypothetical protein